MLKEGIGSEVSSKALNRATVGYYYENNGGEGMSGRAGQSRVGVRGKKKISGRLVVKGVKDCVYFEVVSSEE